MSNASDPWNGHVWHCDSCKAIVPAQPHDSYDRACSKCRRPMRYDFPEPADGPHRCFHCGRRTKDPGYRLDGDRFVPPTCIRTPCMDALSEHWNVLLDPAN